MQRGCSSHELASAQSSEAVKLPRCLDAMIGNKRERSDWDSRKMWWKDSARKGGMRSEQRRSTRQAGEIVARGRK